MTRRALERWGLCAGVLVGLAANSLVLLLPNPSNVVALRVLGFPLLFAVGLLTLVIPPAGLLSYVVVPIQWTLVGWLAGRFLAHRTRGASSRAPGT
jgi:hypothetical protein